MARRKIRAVRIDNKLILNVIGASLIVQKAPALINRFFPLDPNITNIAGVGAGYLVGVLMRNPQLANASLALGITGFLEPIVDSFIDGTTIPQLSPPSPMGMNKIMGRPVLRRDKTAAVEDFITLNEYIDDPSTRQSYSDYSSVY